MSAPTQDAGTVQFPIQLSRENWQSLWRMAAAEGNRPEDVLVEMIKADLHRGEHEKTKLVQFPSC